MWGRELEEALDRYVPTVEGKRAIREIVDRAAATRDDTWGEPGSLPGHAATPPVGARYADLGLLGRGGMGEVRRVRDTRLQRPVAMKVIRSELLWTKALVDRFLAEAHVTAWLQHPGIAPVHEVGQLPDGRWYFTMREVTGRTMSEVIAEVHARSSGTRWVEDADGWSLRRLVEALHQATEAVAYAHAQGVVHRDLKPANIMVGAYREVLVLDWGVAKVRGAVAADLEAADTHADETRMGALMGTPGFMPPEQARGEVDRVDARSDVYALGGVLYQILCGERPQVGLEVLECAPQPVSSRTGLPLPEELVEACERAMSRAPEGRYPDAKGFAEALRAWLDGSRRREVAMGVVAAAEATGPEAEALLAAADALRGEAQAELKRVAAWAPEEEKAPLWAKEDEAAALEREASLLHVRRESLLRGALTHDPTLPEAHAALARRFREEHAQREAARGDAAAAEAHLREHLAALPATHPERVRGAAYLSGEGALTLHTDPSGAEVLLYRYQRHHRRLTEVFQRSLGRTPLDAVPLAMGSYLCVLRHPDRAEVRYPVHIGRGEHWDGTAPGEVAPRPMRMPALGELGPDERFVPAGWFRCGGDPEATDALPGRRLWCDDLVVKRLPVTNREYLAFLDDLVATGREDEADRYQPHERAAPGRRAPLYGRDPDGRFVLRPDADGDVWDPDWPVFLVDWFSAGAFATWAAAKTGRPWRLPGELEWEKAARGVDGRLYPWGDFIDASWASGRHSQPGRPLPVVVDSFPVDASPYGVRGLGGGVQDWCADVFRIEGPALVGGVVAPPGAGDEDVTSQRVSRGGNWNGVPDYARSARRYRSAPATRGEFLGFRVVYSRSP